MKEEKITDQKEYVIDLFSRKEWAMNQTSEFRVRPSEFNDWEQVEKLANRIKDRFGWPYDAWYNERLFVAEKGKRIIGYISYDNGCLDSMAVAKHFRGKGAATALLYTCLEALRTFEGDHTFSAILDEGSSLALFLQHVAGAKIEKTEYPPEEVKPESIEESVDRYFLEKEINGDGE